MAIETRTIPYRDGDTHLEGYLAWDNNFTEPRPAVAIAHAFRGRTTFEEEKARILAEEGYIGFALDMYGSGKTASTTEECMALMQPFLDDRAMLQQRMLAALATLREQTEVDNDRVAAMGYCFGGLCALDLARTGADISGAVSFHGSLTPPHNLAGNAIGARILCLHGYDDPMATPAAMLDLADELSLAGADWQIHAYGHTVHSFTNPDANDPERGTVYNPDADRRSWTSLLNFLEEIFTV